MTTEKGPNGTQLFKCESCNFMCSTKSKYDRHLLTAKHLNATHIQPKKGPQSFNCEMCNLVCSKKSKYDRHLLTTKHINTTRINTTNIQPKKGPLQIKCECGKKYTHRASLFNHKKKCKYTRYEKIMEVTVIDEPISQDNIVKNLMKQNEQLHKMIINRDEEQKKRDEEQKKRDEHNMNNIENLSKQISNISSNVTTNNNTNNTTNNTTNNKFNLNFFLNTQCKDAMSIQSFMENLQLGCKELEHMGDVGYLNGMIDIFNNTLGNMDIYKRPLHCTDLKREVLYFKQGTDWEKDSDDKQHLKKLIKNVETKNYHNLQDWQKDHPDSRECDTRENQHYMKIATEALGGADFNKDSIYLSKIMKHILKDVIVKPQ